MKRAVDVDGQDEGDGGKVMCVVGQEKSRRGDAGCTLVLRREGSKRVGNVASGPEGRSEDQRNRSCTRYNYFSESEIVDYRPRKKKDSCQPVVGKTCLVGGCDRKHHARGYCKPCYQKNLRRLQQQPGYAFRRICCLDDCFREHHARDFCKMHYVELRRVINRVVRAKGKKRYWLWDLI